MEAAPRRANPHDKYLITIHNLEEDYCSWRIPDEPTYGEFFVCFQGQHEVGGGILLTTNELNRCAI